MIQFHYHKAQHDVPRLGIVKGALLCHIFSDLADVADATRELQRWAAGFGPIDVRIQRYGTRRQHIDLWGPWLAACGPPADRPALRAWLRGSKRWLTNAGRP
ncbi:MAG: hypothetical protein HYY04_07385 [Chloroflexi bacterium]|nr:hypothetical protein [Chloroflexota bacterium]